MQTKLYQSVIDVQDELDNGNNKYAVVVLYEKVGDVLEILEGTTAEAQEFHDNVLKPVFDESGRVVVNSGRPDEEDVRELIDGIRYSINEYEEYNLRIVDWTEYKN